MIMMKDELIKAVQKMVVHETLLIDTDRVREDFYGLFGDIIAELSRRSPGRETMIYDYAELMAKEQDMYIPEQAYEAGVSARGSEHDSAFMNYARCLLLHPENQKVLKERDAMYYELRGLLGETGGLLDEFNELYRTCHGIVSRKIDVFFDMGFYGDAKLTEEQG